MIISLSIYFFFICTVVLCNEVVPVENQNKANVIATLVKASAKKQKRNINDSNKHDKELADEDDDEDAIVYTDHSILTRLRAYSKLAALVLVSALVYYFVYKYK
ncbi:hypothetical protein IPH25_00920 [bacterium]|nr:MAG: hypothetical protein IPG37_03040 [bacterium]QQR61988.1 MAG: hypothetical protein IPH25_00920 [bacterium]QQR62419.1 MAG: hypothetical protein IPH67_03240 [bacterium]